MPRLGFRPTIRTRLTLAATLVTIAILTIASLTLVTIQSRALTNGIDEFLTQTADNLAPVSTEVPNLPPVGDPEDTFAQVIDTNGNVVASTPNIPEHPLVAVTVDGITTARVDQPAGHFRILTRTIGNGDRDLVLVVGKNLDDVSDSVRVLVAALAIVSPVLILLLVGLSWWLVGRTLRPVGAIRHEVQSIGGSQLHRRVPVPNSDDEIATLARTMNDMLARVQEASEQQQRFVDDASHELRTPLTRMITDLEVAVAHPDDEDPTTTLRRVRDDASELQKLVEDLLFLARSAHDRRPPDIEVDLHEVTRSVAADARTSSNLVIDTRAVDAVVVRGDERALSRAITNIVTNAVHHARSSVTIALRSDARSARLTVDDDGHGIPPGERQRVFERFTRLDEARGRDSGGSGLGLAIAAEIVQRHGGIITVSDSPSGGARFTITLEPHDASRPWSLGRSPRSD